MERGKIKSDISKYFVSIVLKGGGNLPVQEI